MHIVWIYTIQIEFVINPCTPHERTLFRKCIPYTGTMLFELDKYSISMNPSGWVQSHSIPCVNIYNSSILIIHNLNTYTETYMNTMKIPNTTIILVVLQVIFLWSRLQHLNFSNEAIYKCGSLPNEHYRWVRLDELNLFL